MNEDVLDRVSSAVNTLKSELCKAEEEVHALVCGAAIYPLGYNNTDAVHLLGDGWVRLCGINREYNVAVHGVYDRDKPWNEHCFKLWFNYNNVEFFCLMTGKELLNVGCALPCEGKTIKRSGGVEQWLRGVQSTAV